MKKFTILIKKKRGSGDNDFTKHKSIFFIFAFNTKGIIVLPSLQILPKKIYTHYSSSLHICAYNFYPSLKRLVSVGIKVRGEIRTLRELINDGGRSDFFRKSLEGRVWINWFGLEKFTIIISFSKKITLVLSNFYDAMFIKKNNHSPPLLNKMGLMENRKMTTPCFLPT